MNKELVSREYNILPTRDPSQLLARRVSNKSVRIVISEKKQDWNLEGPSISNTYEFSFQSRPSLEPVDCHSETSTRLTKFYHRLGGKGLGEIFWIHQSRTPKQGTVPLPAPGQGRVPSQALPQGLTLISGKRE